MPRSENVASTLLSFSLRNFNFSEYISLKSLSNIPASLIAFKSSINRKTVHKKTFSSLYQIYFMKFFFEDLLSICSHNSVKTGWKRMKQGQDP